MEAGAPATIAVAPTGVGGVEEAAIPVGVTGVAMGRAAAAGGGGVAVAYQLLCLGVSVP